MDQTLRPLKIPPEYLHYAEQNTLFELFQVGMFFSLALSFIHLQPLINI